MYVDTYTEDNCSIKTYIGKNQGKKVRYMNIGRISGMNDLDWRLSERRLLWNESFSSSGYAE